MKKSTSYRDSVEHIEKMLSCLSRYIGKHSISSEAFCMNQVTFALLMFKDNQFTINQLTIACVSRDQFITPNS